MYFLCIFTKKVRILLGWQLSADFFMGLNNFIATSSILINESFVIFQATLLSTFIKRLFFVRQKLNQAQFEAIIIIE